MKIKIDMPGYRREFECEDAEVRFTSDMIYVVGSSDRVSSSLLWLAVERAKRLIRNRKNKTAWRSTLAERVKIKPYIDDVWAELERDPDFDTGPRCSTYIGGKNGNSG